MLTDAAKKNPYKQINWDVIISSPLKRALKTAEIINNHLNLTVEHLNRFLV